MKVATKNKTEAEQVTAVSQDESRSEWLEEDFSGQLAVDVYQTDKDIVIQSTIAGVRPEDLDISLTNDMVTIKGLRRREQAVPDEAYLFRECYWGGFSRRVILPIDVRTDRVNATMKDGVLTVVLPKLERPRPKTIRVQEEAEENNE